MISNVHIINTEVLVAHLIYMFDIDKVLISSHLEFQICVWNSDVLRLIFLNFFKLSLMAIHHILKL